MKAYKLTDENNRTFKETQWGENVTHTATGTPNVLCSSGWIHFYTDPLLAVFMNPAHAYFDYPRLWECETSGEHLHEPLKSGCKTLTTIKEIPVPWVTKVQIIAFVILCTKKMVTDVTWNAWANNWLSGKNRSEKTANKTAILFGESSIYYSCLAAVGYDTHWYAAFGVASVKNRMDCPIDFVAIAKEAMTYK